MIEWTTILGFQSTFFTRSYVRQASASFQFVQNNLGLKNICIKFEYVSKAFYWPVLSLCNAMQECYSYSVHCHSSLHNAIIKGPHSYVELKTMQWTMKPVEYNIITLVRWVKAAQLNQWHDGLLGMPGHLHCVCEYGTGKVDIFFDGNHEDI